MTEAAEPLRGRAALVTGGGSGQGRAACLALAALGADIVFGAHVAHEGERAVGTTFPTPGEMAQTAAEIEAHGVGAHGRHHDARSDESCQALVDAAIERFGRVDILVNAAGVCIQGAVADQSEADWEKVIDINLTGAYRMVKRCLPGMIAGGWGRIVLIASTAANVGAPGHGAYCASKAGLLGLMRCAALEGALHGVTCNAVNPGFVDTGMVRGDMEALARREGIALAEAYRRTEALSPMNRMLAPEEIAAAVAFLCSDGARGLTGEDIDIAMGSLW